MTISADTSSQRFGISDFLVSEEAVRCYADAIGASAFAHGDLAVPSFAVVPILPCIAAARQSVTSAPGFHAEHKLQIYAPLRTGMRVSVESAVAGVWPTPAGLTIIVRAITTAADGLMLNEQFFSILVPGDKRVTGYGIRFPDHRMPDGVTSSRPVAEIDYEFGAELGRRYAEASGDRSAYTFDDAAARQRGLPGAIVSGICTLSFIARGLAETLGEPKGAVLRHISLRFARLLLLRDSQRLSCRFWPSPSDEAGQYRFEAYDRDGTAVVTHGLARLAA